MKANYKVFG